jgi:hypothetical protein
MLSSAAKYAVALVVHSIILSLHYINDKTKVTLNFQLTANCYAAVQSLRVQRLVWCKPDLTNLLFLFIGEVRHVSSISDSLDTSFNAALIVIWMFHIVLCTTYQNCLYIALFLFSTSLILSVGCKSLDVICHALCWSKSAEQSCSSGHSVAKAKVMH